MKQLTCEMCGSTELIKQDGFFVCQTCGCKYSVEEAKKMMIEGTVDVRGTVQVDNSAFVKKYLENARRAKEKEDWEETEKYYNLVEQNDPNNIEAIFYSAYGKAKASLVDDDIYKRQAVFKVLTNCISILDDKYDIERREENQNAIMDIAIDLGNMVCSSFVFTQWKNSYGVVTRTNKGDTYTLFGGLIDAYRETIANIQKIDDQPCLHEASIRLYTVAQHTGIGNWKKLMAGWIEQENAALEFLQKKKIEEYWEEHKEDKLRLDQELLSLNTEKGNYIERINDIQKKKGNVPALSQLIKIQKEIEELDNQKKALGLFKGKEKKAIQEKIDSLDIQKKKLQVDVQNQQKEVEQQYETELNQIRAKLNEVAAKVKDIENELTRDRNV